MTKDGNNLSRLSLESLIGRNTIFVPGLVHTYGKWDWIILVKHVLCVHSKCTTCVPTRTEGSIADRVVLITL